ncbi:uncharacterized protein LOC120009541 isoform X2 [Tripterygium wilfordii]|uniref:uncharacterized protein LOC120009541 isoform X2 n=1 Tax=Tripterygium wilfordii TaxID=458696 RepID=UPI0018F83C39|nr:uncharacterized protein LOC120009541 isoform X2 [Tripterygium wilfordii]
MSWLARSLANSLRLDDAENDVTPTPSCDASPATHLLEQRRQVDQCHNEGEVEGDTRSTQPQDDEQSRGVKEDLTEFKQTLTRQLWGVASFLAPPPTPSHHEYKDQSGSNFDQFASSDPSVSGDLEEEGRESDPVGISGIRSDFGEIGGRFREISKMASNYFPFGAEEDEGENEVEYEEEKVEEDDNIEENAVGITDEVLAFARNIAMHPETWLDFPLDEEEDLDDFDMSDAQREHASAIEHLAPQLAALRIELCPCHMTESYFWKVYFVLLHSRLNREDAEILSSSQIMAARTLWMKELQKQTKSESVWLGNSNYHSNDNRTVLDEEFFFPRVNYVPENMRFGAVAFEPAPSASTSTSMTEYEMEKHPVVSTEMQCIDKSVIEEKQTKVRN